MNYALIQSGFVINTIVWDGEAPIVFPDGVVAVNIPDDVMCGIGYTAVQNDDQTWAFTAPPVAPPTPEQLLAANTATRNQLLAAANLVIPALQDAVDLEDPSANPVLLKAWKQFRVDVNKVVLTVANPVWPMAPQPGYGAAVSSPVSSS
jgi:hypothetical protein